MIDETNPAGRLYKILAAARQKPQDAKVRDVWADVLDCPTEDDAELSRRVVEVYGLSQETQKLLRLLPDLNHDLYLTSFPKLEKAIFPLNLQATWQPQRNILLDEGVLTRLQFCAEELGKHYSEEAIGQDDLEEISSLLADLFSSVETSSIPTALRLAVLEELERIRAALSMYRIKGAKGVKEAMQALLGAVVANRESLQDLPTDESDVLQRLGKLIDKLDSFTA